MSKVNVMLGELTKPLSTFKVEKGTTLEEFLQEQEIEFNSSIRVNGETAKKDDKLSEGDIITITEAVSGGL